LKGKSELGGNVNPKVEILLPIPEAIPERPKIGSFRHSDDGF
jgi:hypothetical protein